MTDFPENTKSPCCNAEAWDLDCDECSVSGTDDEGNACDECDGEGYIIGWCECSECGDTFDENDRI